MNAINKKIMKLWEETAPELTLERMPIFYGDLQKNGILFVGSNPSFSKAGFSSFLKDSKFHDIDPVTFFQFPQSEAFSVEKSVQIDQLAKDKYRYYSKFRKIAKEVNLGWEHVDLFFVRKTSQKDVKKLVCSKGETLSDFGRNQLALSKKLIDEAKPQIIVVASAFASRLFKAHFKAKFNTDLGYHEALIADKMTPVFLTSMLTGQRALDKFSCERLCWNIARVLKDRK